MPVEKTPTSPASALMRLLCGVSRLLCRSAIFISTDVSTAAIGRHEIGSNDFASIQIYQDCTTVCTDTVSRAFRPTLNTFNLLCSVPTESCLWSRFRSVLTRIATWILLTCLTHRRRLCCTPSCQPSIYCSPSRIRSNFSFRRRNLSCRQLLRSFWSILRRGASATSENGRNYEITY